MAEKIPEQAIPCYNSHMRKAFKGFTIVELVVVVAVIGILSTIGVVSFVNIQKKSRDDQRLSQVTLIGEAIEKYYDTNGKYPDCATLKANYADILSDLDKNVLVSPTATNKSLISIRCNTDTDDLPEDGSDVFYYDYSNDGNWTLKHYSEIEKSVAPKAISNRRTKTAITVNDQVLFKLTTESDGSGSVDQNNTTWAIGAEVLITAIPDNSWVFDKWDGDDGCAGNASHKIKMTSNKICTAHFKKNSYQLSIGAIPSVAIQSSTGGGSHIAGSSITLEVIAETGYKFNKWSPSECASGEFDMPNENLTCIANFTIDKPTMAEVSASTKDSLTTWSWNDDDICPTGTTTSYQYLIYIDSGYNIEKKWAPTDTSFKDSIIDNETGYGLTKTSYFRSTVWEGYEYKLEVQARCTSTENAGIKSEWSNSKNDTFYRPIQPPGKPKMYLVISTSGKTYTNNAANIRFKPTCSGGSQLIISYDVKQANNYHWNNDVPNKGQWWRHSENRQGRGLTWLSYTNYPKDPSDPSETREYVVAKGWLKWRTGYNMQITNSRNNIVSEQGSGWGATVLQKCSVKNVDGVIRYNENSEAAPYYSYTDTDIYVGKHGLY